MQIANSVEIARTARRLITLHGAEAPTVAARHAGQMEKLGDAGRRTKWLRVMIRAQNLLVSKHGW
jgi:hypothetical protein